jgi:glycosyltransferase involved in cell wall biosynthesis
MLSEKYKIVLVGLSTEQINNLPDNIDGLPLTKTPQELAEIYSAADWFINPSMEETMGLVTVEALACGTPVIVSNFTSVPEVVNEKCGRVVKCYNANGFYHAIINNDKKYTLEECIGQARNYNMVDKYREYLNLYNHILN